MIEFSTNCGGDFCKLTMSGKPDDLCNEMLTAIERFTFQMLFAMPQDKDEWPQIAAEFATGFSFAVRQGLEKAKEKAE